MLTDCQSSLRRNYTPFNAKLAVPIHQIFIISSRMPLVFFSENCDTKSSSPLSVEYYMYVPMHEGEDGVGDYAAG